MPIITLTTDLGNTDHYVSAVKANILRQLESVNIIDISHNIPTFNVLHAWTLSIELKRKEDEGLLSATKRKKIIE